MFRKTKFENITENGEWLNFSCPLAPFSHEHNFKPDSRPSAGAKHITETLVYWHCFTCKGSGSLQSLYNYLLTKQNLLAYSEALKELKSSVESVPDWDNRFIHKSEEPDVPVPFSDIFEDITKYDEGFKYVLNRNVSIATIRKIGLVYDPEGKRVVFPVKSSDNLIYGFTGRAVCDKSYTKIKDYYFRKSHFILGVEHWKPDQPVVLVEGLFAYARLHEMTKGRYFPYNIGAIMGSSISKEQVNILITFGSPVYCLLDNDNAGKIGMFGKPSKTDWSNAKNAMEQSKGMVYQLTDQLPTYICKWPLDVNGNEKTDPDNLTYDELTTMLGENRMVLG